MHTAELSAPVGQGAVNKWSDVVLVQQLLNQRGGLISQLPPLRTDGVAGPATISAIIEFQRCAVGLANPDGRIDPGGPTWQVLVNGQREPAWMKVARREIGTKALPGREKNSPRILEYLATFPYLKRVWGDKAHTYHLADVDETPWCASFVNWCLIRAGKPSGPSARAIDWMNYGQKLDEPRPGAITVVHHNPGKTTRGTTSSGNHVAFFVEQKGSRLTLLGGNQSHAVNKKTFTGWLIKAYRWPK